MEQPRKIDNPISLSFCQTAKNSNPMSLTFSDPEVQNILTELHDRFPKQVAKAVTRWIKKHGIAPMFDMCIDYQVGLKENQLAAQRAAYQINKQSIKDQNCLKRIVKTHGIEFVKKHT